MPETLEAEDQTTLRVILAFQNLIHALCDYLDFALNFLQKLNICFSQMDFFVRHPTSGQLYQAFKNAKRGLPEEFRLRCRQKNTGDESRRKASDIEPVVEAQVDGQTEEKGTYYSSNIHTHCYCSCVRIV